MSKPEGFNLDVRVRERLLRARVISQAEVDAHLGALTDLDGDVESLAHIPQPAVVDTRALAEQERAAAAAEQKAAAPAPAPAPVSSYFAAPASTTAVTPSSGATDWMSALSAVASAPRSHEWKSPISGDPAASALESVLVSRFGQPAPARPAVSSPAVEPAPTGSTPGDSSRDGS